MNAAAPKQGFLCGGSVPHQKNTLPAVPRRDPEAEVFRIENDFHGSDMN
jgi:hypothetical protein